MPDQQDPENPQVSIDQLKPGIIVQLKNGLRVMIEAIDQEGNFGYAYGLGNCSEGFSTVGQVVKVFERNEYIVI
tara:strand:- start:259 stop:480 length:222 start_codon:yes stop_codon:yes gene_type:complete